MGSLLSSHDQAVTSPVIQSGFTSNPDGPKKPAPIDHYLKLRMYTTVIPEIQKKMGPQEADFILQQNRRIQKQFFWSSLISMAVTMMSTYALMKRERSKYVQKTGQRFPFTKIVKYIPFAFVVSTMANFVVFRVFERVTNEGKEVAGFMEKNEERLDQIVKERYNVSDNQEVLRAFQDKGKRQ